MREAFRTLTAAGWALAAICLLLMIVLIWWSATAGGRERARQDRAIQAANAQAHAADAAARDRAADQRLTDLKINTRLEKERTDAVSAIPDARPTAGRVTPIYPPSADLAVEAKPIMPPEAVRSEAAGIAHDIAIEGWGERGWDAVGRLCRWAADNGMKGLSCPPPPELPPRPG